MQKLTGPYLGFPIATVPLDILNYNGRPFGLSIMAQEYREDLLFAFMKAWETSFPWRPIPKMLDRGNSS